MIFRRTQTGRLPRRRPQAGFTLVELLVVMAIISVLAALLVPALEKALQTARTAACLSNQRQIGVALAVYCGDWEGRLPPLYSAPSTGAPYLPYLLAASGLGSSTRWQDYNIFSASTRKNLSKTPLGKCAAVGGPGALAKIHHDLTDYGTNVDHVTWAMDKTLNLAQFPNPSSTMFSIDATEETSYLMDGVYHNATGWWVKDPIAHPLASQRYDPRHGGGANLSFLDGRAVWLPDGAILNNKDDLWNHEHPVRPAFGPY